MLKIIYYTTTDGEYLSVFQAYTALCERFPGAFALEFFGKNTARAGSEIRAHLDGADFVLMTLMGTFAGMDDFDELVGQIHERGIPLHIQSSVMKGTAQLRAKSAQGEDFHKAVEEMISAGGSGAYQRLFLYLSNTLKGTDFALEEAEAAPLESLYYRGELFASLDAFYAKYPRLPLQGALLFHRSQYLSENTGAVDALIAEGERAGIRLIGFFFYSATASDLRNRRLKEAFLDFFPAQQEHVQVIVNLAGFSINTATSQVKDETDTGLREIGLPILKAFCSTGTAENWRQSPQGLTPADYSMSLVMPEYDGQIMGHLVSHKEKITHESLELPFHSPHPCGVRDAVEMACGYARLRRKENKEKRIAIILHNYPPGDANIGSASGLDTFASLALLLKRLQAEGYAVERVYPDGEELLEDVLRHGTNEREWVDPERKADRSVYLSAQEYARAFSLLPPESAEKVRGEWGPPPGDILVGKEGILIPGFSNGNIFLTMQPSRGFGDDPGKITHSPDLAPHHQYIAFYHYLKNIWKADAYLHVGTHGTLEFLPGKSTGLSGECFPNLLLRNVPNFYYYIVKNPGEGTIAKRRSCAALISYLIPRLSLVQGYEELDELEAALEQYERASYEGMESSQVYWEEASGLIEKLHLGEDLELDAQASRETVLAKVWNYLYEIKSNYITKGLHVLGAAPDGDDLLDMLLVLLRTENGEIPSLVSAYAASRGYEMDVLRSQPQECSYGKIRNGEILMRLMSELKALLGKMQAGGWDREQCGRILSQEQADSPDLLRTTAYLLDSLLPRLAACTDEIDSLLEGLAGRYILPGKSGNISRGGADILPTGRNFYTLDPMTVPTKSAWKTGRALGDAVLEDYFLKTGRYPESVAVVLWGLSTLRSRGDCLAEIYYLLGLEPVWEAGTARVSELRVIPPEELGRPRIDVTVRISGVFRDIFPHQIPMLEKAFALVASLEEKESDNFLLRHVAEDIAQAVSEGKSAENAREEAMLRVFGSKPGAYGTGVSHAVDESAWQSQDDLADIFLNWGSYAYTSSHSGVFQRKCFEQRLKNVEATVQNATSRETDILHVDDYYQYHGGLAGAVRFVRGEKPVMYCGDSSDPDHIKLREADKELKYVYRSRVLNPQWIDSMTEHGYKAAGDFSKMFKYALGWDATADIMDNWMYDALAEKYVLDPEMQEFFEQNNPLALKDMIETLLEAEQRGLWEASQEMISALYEQLLQAEAHAENHML